MEPLNQKQAAELIGKSPNWLRNSDCPKLDGGKYDPVSVAGWFIDHETADYQELKDRREELRTQAVEARAHKLSAENAIASGELMTKSDFAPIGRDVATPIHRASSLLARGGTFTPLDAAKLLRRACSDSKRIIEMKLSSEEKE